MIEDWLELNIDSTIKHTGNGKEVHFCCPICNETRHRMFVNLNSGQVYCHNCQFKGNIISLIQVVEGVSWSKANKVFSEIKGNLVLPENVALDLEDKLLIGDLRKDLDKRAIPLPEEYRLINLEKPNLLMRRAIRYLHSRKITDKQILSYNMGVCASGDYENRIIIPITEDDTLRFWVARAIGASKLKEKSPSNEDYQISKSEVVFNLDKAARKYNSCVISEGIYDALSWGDIGVSLLGKTLYDAQLRILLDYRELLTEGVYIAVDYDARDKATEMAENLIQYFQVFIINIPEEYDDPNKYLQKHNKKAMRKLILEAEKYTEFSGLRRKLS